MQPLAHRLQEPSGAALAVPIELAEQIGEPTADGRRPLFTLLKTA
jgi:hypothetical protein